MYFSGNVVSLFQNPNKCEGQATHEPNLNPTLPLNRSAAGALCVYEEPHHVVNGSTCRQ